VFDEWLWRLSISILSCGGLSRSAGIAKSREVDMAQVIRCATRGKGGEDEETRRTTLASRKRKKEDKKGLEVEDIHQPS
jgi:hypothetical protein